MSNAAKICPACGATNKVSARICAKCLTSILNVKPGAFVADPTPKQNLAMELHIYDRATSQVSDTQYVVIPADDGEYIVGREDTPHIPDIDLKPYAAKRSVAGVNSGYLISRSHAILLRHGRMLQIVLHPQSSKRLYIWPMGNGLAQREVLQGKPQALTHGDVVVFGNPLNPEAVIVRLLCK